MDQLFAQAEICRHCRTALRSAFEHTGTPVVYHRRQMIAWSGDSAQHVCLILDGCVKQYLLAPDGSAHTILLLGQGDIFNEVTFFHNDTSYAATQAVSDTTLVKIPTDVFRAILKAHPALYGDNPSCFPTSCALPWPISMTSPLNRWNTGCKICCGVSVPRWENPQQTASAFPMYSPMRIWLR